MENADSDEGGEKKTTIDAGKEAAIEAEVQAARQRAVVPLEIRMKQFRDMLAEKEVLYVYLCNIVCSSDASIKLHRSVHVHYAI